MLNIEKLRQEQSKILAGNELQVPPEIHFLIGTARMNLEQFDPAIEDFRQALALRPAYGEVHNNLAVIYLYRKDYPQAWEHLHAAEKAGVRINPQFREELAALAPEPPAPAR
jgi:Flp pilus assembly protein TadD